MQELISKLERNTVAVRQRTTEARIVLDTPESISAPVHYHRVMRELSDLLPVWIEHGRLLSQAQSLISHETGRMAVAVLRQFEEDVAATTSCLELASSAGWARTPALGVNALRVRSATILASILCQLEKEHTTLLPLLRRDVARRVELVPAVRQMATA
jgi:hypothetical protein